MPVYKTSVDPINQVNQFKDQPGFFVLNHTNEELRTMFQAAVTHNVELGDAFIRAKSKCTGEQRKRMVLALDVYNTVRKTAQKAVLSIDLDTGISDEDSQIED